MKIKGFVQFIWGKWSQNASYCRIYFCRWLLFWNLQNRKK